MALDYDTVTILDSVCVAIQDYPSWNRPDTFLAECSTTFTSIPLTSCAYAHLMYITSCIYSVGQSTQFSSAVVDALSTAIYMNAFERILEKSSEVLDLYSAAKPTAEITE